jgi:hypothetical protein
MKRKTFLSIRAYVLVVALFVVTVLCQDPSVATQNQEKNEPIIAN